MNLPFTIQLSLIIGLNFSYQAKAEVPGVKPKVAPTFGKVFEMAGTIRQAIPNQRMKRPGPEWFIEITAVDGKVLAKSIVVEFSHVRKSEEPNFKKNGLSLKIAAYETGQFRGIPKNYAKYADPWQDVGFHFRRELFIVKILD